MIINARVIPNAPKDKIIEDNGILRVYVKARAIDNKANIAVCDSLAEHFKVRKSRVILIRGQKSRDKVFDIAN